MWLIFASIMSPPGGRAKFVSEAKTAARWSEARPDVHLIDWFGAARKRLKVIRELWRRL
jgi:hypothetical protein